MAKQRIGAKLTKMRPTTTFYCFDSFAGQIFLLRSYKAMIHSEDVCFDIFAFISKNELEKLELVSNRWKYLSTKGVGAGYLKQKRVFSKLTISELSYEEPGDFVFFLGFRSTFEGYVID
jgi:hypothetical protein